MQTKQLDFSGKKLSYVAIGKGPLVMLLHGFGEDRSIWRRQSALFPGYRLLLPDLPGSGDSDTIDDMSIEGLAEAMKAILDAEGGEGATLTLIGHSMGGYVTLAFAERYPQRLRSFGLFHSTAFADSEEKREVRKKGIRFIRNHGAAEFLKTSLPNLYSPTSKTAHPEWIAEQFATADNFSSTSLVYYYEAMMQRPDRTAVLTQASVPVLFVMGRYDAAVSLEDGLKQCYLPGIAYIHILDHSGHMGMVEEPEKANQILLSFINAIEKTA